MTLLNDCTPAQNGSVGIPEWVPPDAYHYLSHVELGKPIRALARSAECHASTILRQIRRIETRRDDPLVDDALETLGRVSRNKITKHGEYCVVCVKPGRCWPLPRIWKKR